MPFLIRIAAWSVLLAPLVDSALAQQPAAAPSAGTPASAAARPATHYRSAFEGYRGYSEQPFESWRKANDLVGSIGGWQAYAREGQGGAATADTAPPAMPAAHAGMHGQGAASAPAVRAPAKAAPAPAAPASAAQKGGHSGHKMP